MLALEAAIEDQRRFVKHAEQVRFRKHLKIVSDKSPT